MKQKIVRVISIVMGLLLAVMVIRINTFDVHAEGVTVTGIVASNTTPSLLYLNTNQGQMQIKLDSNTDFSQCRVLVGGQTVSVTIYRGDDAYNHASKVTSTSSNSSNSSSSAVASAGTVTMNGITLPNVTGTVAGNSTTSTLYLNMNGSQMEIRIDGNTDATNCRLLKSGLTVTAAVYRGQDAVMHAAKLTAKDAVASSSASVNRTNTISVTGTIASNSTPNVIYLNTGSGQMQLAMDSTASIGSKVVVAGSKITCKIGYGSDATWHVVSIDGSAATETTSSSASTLTGSSATINGQNMIVVSGTAASNSNGEYLYLNTSGGQMQLKIDSNCDVTESRIIVPGHTYQAAIHYGGEYWYAAKISASKATTSTATVNTTGTVTVIGTVNANSTEDMLHLGTNGGEMQIRLDTTTKYPGILYNGEVLSVVVGYGSDATWHAISISK